MYVTIWWHNQNHSSRNSEKEAKDLYRKNTEWYTQEGSLNTIIVVK